MKSCKEAKQIATAGSLSTAKARTEDLRKTVEKQRSREVEYESIVSMGNLFVYFGITAKGILSRT